MSLSNQGVVSQNYIENEALVSTVDFHVQSAVSWETFIGKSTIITIKRCKKIVLIGIIYKRELFIAV